MAKENYKKLANDALKDEKYVPAEIYFKAARIRKEGCKKIANKLLKKGNYIIAAEYFEKAEMEKEAKECYEK